MREYTTIPNVFRLASLQTINNSNNNFNLNNNHNNSTNNNGYSYDNNAYNDNHATSAQQSMTTTMTTTMATTTQAIVHNGGECNNINNSHNNVAANDAAGSENVAIRINYPHKLTTIASIERNCNATETKAHSLNNDHMGIITNGNLRLKMSTNQKPISSAAVNDERIINTISGSIPSTGYTATTNNCNSLDRSDSLVNDLNISFTDLSQLNTIEQQQNLMPLSDFHLLRNEHDNNNYQQQQQHYQSSRRLNHKSPFYVNLDRKNDNNSYLWILTPVAAR